MKLAPGDRRKQTAEDTCSYTLQFRADQKVDMTSWHTVCKGEYSSENN